ncbi:hypothetical protein SCHPADRAFT_55809 [Schizopora paradoxa]|uniref:Uncharacterized protein n=1 Tax=Schizopora paradoxa TaxID=27342 RepID=A0A0H2S605_9AGAM|nr:hypothetical protein SCHPADRAFT_55809 [Schizopora paradoxa]
MAVDAAVSDCGEGSILVGTTCQPDVHTKPASSPVLVTSKPVAGSITLTKPHIPTLPTHPATTDSSSPTGTSPLAFTSTISEKISNSDHPTSITSTSVIDTDAEQSVAQPSSDSDLTKATVFQSPPTVGRVISSPTNGTINSTPTMMHFSSGVSSGTVPMTTGLHTGSEQPLIKNSKSLWRNGREIGALFGTIGVAILIATVILVLRRRRRTASLRKLPSISAHDISISPFITIGEERRRGILHSVFVRILDKKSDVSERPQAEETIPSGRTSTAETEPPPYSEALIPPIPPATPRSPNTIEQSISIQKRHTVMFTSM